MHGTAFETMPALNVDKLINDAADILYYEPPKNGKSWEHNDAVSLRALFFPREVHYKTRVPLHIVSFETISDALTARSHIVSRANSFTINPSGSNPTYYVGSAGQRPKSGKRISFYYAAARHKAAVPGETDIELQLFGHKEVSVFHQEVKEQGLAPAFFSRLQQTIEFSLFRRICG